MLVNFDYARTYDYVHITHMHVYTIIIRLEGAFKKTELELTQAKIENKEKNKELNKLHEKYVCSHTYALTHIHMYSYIHILLF